MGKLRCGVIGAAVNLRANMVFHNFPKDRAELTEVCDIKPEALKTFSETYPDFHPHFSSDYHDLVTSPNVDAVFIMVRDVFHEEMAVAALEAGKAVYLEKPMAITLDGCDRILRTAYRTHAKLMVGHNMRYMPCVVKMKELLDSGIIGDIRAVWVRHFINYGSSYFRNWCSLRENTTGLLLQKGAHDIDVVHWLTNSHATRVVGMGGLSVYNQCTDRLAPDEDPDRKASWVDSCWPPLEIKKLANKMDVEDHTMILMQLTHGIQASYEQCFFTPDHARDYTFIGTRGRLENFGITGDCKICVWTNRRSTPEPDITYNVFEVKGGHGGADPQILKAFFDFVEFGISPVVTPIAARQAVAAGYLGHQSMRNGNVPMDIPELPEELVQYFENGQR